MKKILTLVCLCVFLAPVSQAQGNKAFNALKRIGQKAGESLSKVQQRAMAQVERVRAQHRVKVYSKREVFTKMPHALVQVIGMNQGACAPPVLFWKILSTAVPAYGPWCRTMWGAEKAGLSACACWMPRAKSIITI